MEIYIEKNYSRNEAKIWLIESDGYIKRVFGYDGKNIVIHTINNHEMLRSDMKPLLRVPIVMLSSILKCFGDEAERSGINTENENLLKGKLEATQEHLSDMREIARHLIFK